jgi:hypothetical protein
MTEATAQPFSPDPPAYPDRDNPAFAFATTEWQAATPITDKNDAAASLINPRKQFLENYRHLSNPNEWNRYLTLGYFAYEDGQTFNSVWNNETTTWLFRHKIIWYNYKYHRSRSFHGYIRPLAQLGNQIVATVFTTSPQRVSLDRYLESIMA